MSTLDRRTARSPRRLTRRSALLRMAAGAAGLALTDLSRATAWAMPKDEPLTGKAAPRAKAVIEIWMWGGPCHIDTFDPKPEAGQEVTGPLGKAIPTNVDGIRIGELLPELAKQADKYALIRSMSHGVNGHETAAYIVQTGRQQGGRLVYPGFGAVVASFKGYDHGYKGLIPPYVVLTRPKGRFSEAGFLGPRYRPFVTGGDPNRDRFTVEGVVTEGVTDERQRRRRRLLGDLDQLGPAIPDQPLMDKFRRGEDKAYDLILGDAGKLFDLSAEKREMRQAYGRSTFGQSCLMARRLVESGVPYVTINYGGWDTHKQHFQAMRRKLPEFDRGLATLLRDLEDRGLLSSTIVWCTGEFGRTPRVQWDPPWNGGRGHFGSCFSTLLAGGGIRGGHVVGASDARGEEVADRPVHPREVLGGMYGLLGIDPDGPLPNPRGLKVSVLDPVEGEVPAPRLPEII